MNIRVTPVDPDFVQKCLTKVDDVTVRDGTLLFWGGWPSQWRFCRFHIDGVVYNCAEQFMMAEKARMFGDADTLEKILDSPYPKAQKEFGREVRGYNEGVWVNNCRSVVFRGNLAKFSQNSDLNDLLRNTRGAIIAEASPYDHRWGIGLRASDPKAANPKAWRGSNWLGAVLMGVRATLFYKPRLALGDEVHSGRADSDTESDERRAREGLDA